MHSKAIQTLYDEHHIILKAIEKAETILKSGMIEKEVNNLKWLIKFFQEYCDLYHHKKEESILFLKIAQKQEMLGMGLVKDLEDHHETFREDLKEILELITAKHWDRALLLLTNYLEDMKLHIDAENFELFVIAEDILNEKEKEDIYYSFLDMDRELGLENKELFEKSLV